MPKATLGCVGGLSAIGKEEAQEGVDLEVSDHYHGTDLVTRSKFQPHLQDEGGAQWVVTTSPDICHRFAHAVSNNHQGVLQSTSM